MHDTRQHWWATVGRPTSKATPLVWAFSTNWCDLVTAVRGGSGRLGERLDKVVAQEHIRRCMPPLMQCLACLELQSPMQWLHSGSNHGRALLAVVRIAGLGLSLNDPCLI
jgi:hypothetical protein